MKLDPCTRFLLDRQKISGGRIGHGPIVLMYHGTPARVGWRLTDRYAVSQDAFREQLDLLLELGYQTVTVRSLAQMELGERNVVAVTFDDGFANNFDAAYCPLLERGMVGTWYVVGRAVGKVATWTPTPEAVLSAAQLREMCATGMEIGSHTLTHPDLTAVTAEISRSEVRDSRREIEDLVGEQVVSFAYPFGRFGNVEKEYVREAGYGLACSTRPGWFSPDNDPLEVRRVTMFSTDTIGHFARKLLFAANDVGAGVMLKYTGARLWDRLIG